MSHKAIQQFVRLQADSEGNPPIRIHLMGTGHWHAPWHGNFEMTPEDLEEMVTNFNDGVGLVQGSNKLPVNYGHDISGKAAGWITQLTVENDGSELWGDVEWTREGLRMLQEGEFKYISPEWCPRSFPYQDPEDEDTWLNNVFTGAGLTNIPLFKKLKPIMASLVQPNRKQASVVTDDSGKHNEGEHPMDLAVLRAKKLEELNDNEKAFVAEHKSELTADELKTFELEDKPETPETPETPEVPEVPETPQPSQPVQASAQGVAGMTEDEVKQLRADAAAGRQALAKLAETEARGFIASAVGKGQIKSGEAENAVKMLLASSPAQRSTLETFINGLPVNENLGKELGDGGLEATGTAAAELNAKVAASIKAAASEGKRLSYYDAKTQILAADTALAARVTNETKEDK